MSRAAILAVVGLLVAAGAVTSVVLLGRGEPNAVCTAPCPDPPSRSPSSRPTTTPSEPIPRDPQAIAPHLVFGDPDTSGLGQWPGQFDVAPTTYDFDGDGVDEIIAQSNDTYVYVFDAEGEVQARLPTTYPPDWHIERILNGVQAAVLRPGERPSLVVTNHAAYVTVWQVAPFSRGSGITFDKVWEQRMDACFWNPGMDARPTLSDLDGDGALEILVQTEEVGFFALDAGGEILWQQCWAGGNSAPVAADLDGNGAPEVIVASDSGLVSVLKGSTGEPLWTFNAAHYVTPGAIPVEPTVADLDGQGELEVLFTARSVPSADPTTWADSHMAIFAVHFSHVTWQAELLWMRQPEWANPLSYTRLAVLDADGDGATDIFGMDWNTVGHSPGNWERLGPAHAFRLDAQGNDVWVQELDTWWSNKDIAIGDANGDGRLEVLANAPAPAGFDSIVSLDAQTGEPVDYLGLAGWQVMRGVTLTDLRHDGSMQAIFPVSPAATGGNGAILVFELDVPYNAPWRGNP